jgi:hypothetical protein
MVICNTPFVQDPIKNQHSRIKRHQNTHLADGISPIDVPITPGDGATMVVALSLRVPAFIALATWSSPFHDGESNINAGEKHESHFSVCQPAGSVWQAVHI